MKNNSEIMKKAIQSKIEGLMKRVMDRVLVTDPFIKEVHKTNRPFTRHSYLTKYLRALILKGVLLHPLVEFGKI